MKRPALCILFAVLSSAARLSARGSIELSFPVHIVPVSAVTDILGDEGQNISSLIYNRFVAGKAFAAGLGTEANFFFGSFGFLDIGLHNALNTDVTFGTYAKGEAKDEKLDDDRDDFLYSIGCGITYDLGLAMRFNLGERSSVAVCPAARALIRFDGGGIAEFTAAASVALRAGYRYWIEKREDMELGVAAFADFALPLIGVYDDLYGGELLFDYFYNRGFEMRLGAGLVINFGTRGIRH